MSDSATASGRSSGVGLLGPVRPGQALTLVLGAVLGVTSIDLSPSVGGAVIAAGVAAAAVGVAAIPVAGRAADQWIPVALAFLISGLKGGRRRHTFISPAPTRGMRRTVGQGAPVEAARPATRLAHGRGHPGGRLPRAGAGHPVRA